MEKKKDNLYCNRCGKPCKEGDKIGDYCDQFHNGVSGSFCRGTIIEIDPDFKLGDTVIHPEVYNGNESFEVVGIRVDELELKGDWSGGTHAVCQTGWYKRKGTVIINSSTLKP